ncbi:Bax inhibitor 1-related [Trinorchestia longiramus]|nr:Bax inhibitor 1-related [Trinorchestia longiramus]
MSYDYESYEEPLAGGSNMEFSEKSIRMAFIKKVMLILMAQLTVTFGIIALFTLVDDVREYTQLNQWLFWVALVLSLVCLFTLACCSSIRRRHPLNIIFLGIFTVCEGFVLGCASASFQKQEILMAVGICVAITFALTIFAFQTRIDFTMMGGFLFVGLMVLMLFGFLTIFFHDRITMVIYSSLGALLFSFYLVFDIQLMIGGRHKYSISPEEYVFAALNIYLDVINLFTYILSIIGNARQ